ncbi:MAG: crosslink repair DNA glycosylase YcaQ family protein [Microbacterium sp.]
MATHRLSAQDARRIAVRAQLLDARRPADVVEVAEQLTLLNIDPTNAIMPSEHHLLWSRIGDAYEQSWLTHAFEHDRVLFEFDGAYRPTSDLELFLPRMRAAPHYASTREWLAANARFRRDILDRLAADGPTATGDIPDTSAVPWPSSGWNNNRNVTMMLEVLLARGEIAVSSREGRERRWDLAERVYPQGLVELTIEEADAARDARRLQSLGIARDRATAVPIEVNHVRDAGEPAVVDGVAGTWRVDPAALAALDEPFAGRTVLLSPFDRLVFDRARALELFGFEYVLEMYKPRAKRRWGYFALPILDGDRLVGKLDAAADRKAGVLRVAAIHEDTAFDEETTDAVHAEIRALAAWLGLGVSGMSDDR